MLELRRRFKGEVVALSEYLDRDLVRCGAMTASTEPGVEAQPRQRGRSSASWRERGARAQQAALPQRVGDRVAARRRSAPAASGATCSEIADALERARQPDECICGSTRAQPAARPATPARAPRRRPSPRRARVARSPLSPGLRTARVHGRLRRIAARAPARSAEHLIAFNGQALAQFAAARSSGLPLAVARRRPTRTCARSRASTRRRRAQYPLEGSWATHLLERNLAEYAAGGSHLRRLALHPRVLPRRGLRRASGSSTSRSRPIRATRRRERASSATRSTSSTSAASRCTRACRC